MVFTDFKANRLIFINFKMGTWHLEAFKMALYIFMPVAAFYGYHQVRLAWFGQTQRYEQEPYSYLWSDPP